MAHVKVLSEGWFLSGCVFRFPIDGVRPVREALVDHGLIEARPEGLGELAGQWMYLYPWTYETTFDWSGEDERCQLELTHAYGACRVTVGDQVVAEDHAPESGALDISHALTLGENRLSLTFVPSGVAEVGLGGRVQLRMGSSMALTAFTVAGEAAQLCACAELTTHTAGRYAFSYVVALGDDAVSSAQFTEALRPGDARVCHQLPLDGVQLFDPARPDDTIYTVRLSIERLGAPCHLAFGKAYFLAPDAAPTRMCRVPDWVDEDLLATRLPILRQLGVDGLIMPEREVLAASMGFLPVTSADQAITLRAFATMEAGNMSELAGEEAYWPADVRTWRLTGSRWPESLDLAALFGANAMGDAPRAARFARFLQAEAIRRAACTARLRGTGAAIDWPFERRACYASWALVEFGGEARPAYDALMEAWKPVAVWAELPDDMRAAPDEQIKIGAYLFSDGDLRGAGTVDIACHRMDGSVIGAITLPVSIGRAARAGELAVTMPKEEGVVIVRVRALIDGTPVAQADETLCVTGGEHPLDPLMKLPLAHLVESGGQLTNKGLSAALAVSSLGYRALLPGEQMPAADTYECLNGLV